MPYARDNVGGVTCGVCGQAGICPVEQAINGHERGKRHQKALKEKRMSQFAPAVAITLAHEGGFFHNTKTGEVVNRGITLKLIRSLGILKTTGPTLQSDVEFVQSLTEEEATDIYELEFWEKNHLEHLESQEVANKVFDLQVNTGQGVIFLQRALGVAADGLVGPKTIAAANAADPVVLLAQVRAQAETYYKKVAAAKPELAENLTGWLTRLNS